MTYFVGNQLLAWDRHNIVAGYIHLNTSEVFIHQILQVYSKQHYSQTLSIGESRFEYYNGNLKQFLVCLGRADMYIVKNQIIIQLYIYNAHVMSCCKLYFMCKERAISNHVYLIRPISLQYILHTSIQFSPNHVCTLTKQY